MSLFHHRRFSNSSALTVSTVSTALPEYTVTEDAEIPEGADDSDGLRPSGSTSEASPLPRYSHIINPRHSILLTWVPGLNEDLTPDDGYCYSLPIKTWATLQLYTRDNIPGNPTPSAAQPKVPRFWASEPIAGVLHLDLASPHSINEIKIVVKGRLGTFSMGWKSLKFLASEHILWKRSSHGDPRQVVQSNSPLTKNKFNNRLVGRYTFPFSFPFPSRFNLLDEKSSSDATISPFLDDCGDPPPPPPPQRGNGEKKELSSETTDVLGVSDAYGISPFAHVDNTGSSLIPQTFSEKGVPESVSYELSVHFTHGKLKPATKIKTDISYMPASQPLPASKRRKKAYEAGTSVPGPFSDSDGWFPTPSSTIRGAFHSDRGKQFKIDCTLYIALPLSFTRGTVIPCFLALSCDEAEALGSLSMQNLPRVVLMRRLRHFVAKAEYTDDNELGYKADNMLTTFDAVITNMHPAQVPGGDVKVGKTLHVKTVLHEVGTAVWWSESSSDEVQSEPSTIRHLQGEIHLPADFEPSCACKIFNVEYYVEMLSPRFVPKLDRHSVSRRSLATVPIEITSLCRTDEPVPIPFSRAPQRVHVRRMSLGNVTV